MEAVAAALVVAEVVAVGAEAADGAENSPTRV
jgi:hypothetical protein